MSAVFYCDRWSTEDVAAPFEPRLSMGESCSPQHVGIDPWNDAPNCETFLLWSSDILAYGRLFASAPQEVTPSHALRCVLIDRTLMYCNWANRFSAGEMWYATGLEHHFAPALALCVGS